MTWNTESIFSAAIKRRKRVEQKKRSSILKSRRPSARHHVALTDKSRCLSASKSRQAPKSLPQGMEAKQKVSLEVVGEDKEEMGKTDLSLKSDNGQHHGQYSKANTGRKTSHLGREGPSKILDSDGGKDDASNIQPTRGIGREKLAGNHQQQSTSKDAVTCSSGIDKAEQPFLQPTASHQLTHKTGKCFSQPSSKAPCARSAHYRLCMENVFDASGHSLEECCGAADSKIHCCRQGHSPKHTSSDLGPEISILRDTRQEVTDSENSDTGPSISVISDTIPDQTDSPGHNEGLDASAIRLARHDAADSANHDLGPGISIIRDEILNARPRMSDSGGTGPDISILQDNRHEVSSKGIKRETSDSDLGPDISALSTTREEREDIGPAMSVVPDVYRPNKTCKQPSLEGDTLHRKAKKRQSYPEKSSRLHYSCAQHVQRSPPLLSKSSQSQHGTNSSRVTCTDLLNKQKAIQEKPSDNTEMCIMKPNLQPRITSRRNRSKFTLRSKDPTSGASTRQTNAQEVKVDPPHSAAHSTEPEIREDAISLQDIDIKIESCAPDESDPNVDSRDESSLAACIVQHCTQEEEQQQAKPPSTRKTARCYISRARRPRCRKVKVHLHRRPRKILVIGDMTTGKTQMISAYCQDRFTENYAPTILHCHQTDAKICGEAIDVVVMEISGRDDFHPLRRRAYHKMDAAVICYSVDSPQSLQRVRDFWVPELRRHAPAKAPFVVVGTKKDLRDEARDRLEEEIIRAQRARECVGGGDDQNKRKQELMAVRLRGEVDLRERYVSRERGKQLAESVGAGAFLECSSLYRDGTREVFETTTKMALKKSRRRRADNRSLEAACIIL